MEEKILCAVCCGFLNEPKKLKCGHQCCGECVRRVMGLAEAEAVMCGCEKEEKPLVSFCASTAA